MAIENTRERAGVLENFFIEVTQVRIDGGKRCDGMPLAKREHVLSAPGRISDIEVDEAAVKECCKRNDRGKGTARMEAFVHGIAALLYVADANVRVLDLKKLDDRFPKEVVFGSKQVVDRETRKIYGTRAHSCA